MANPPELSVIHVNTNLRWGGGEQQILDLVRGSVAHGVCSTLIARPDGELYRRAEAARVCRLLPFEFRSPYNPWAVSRLCRLLRLVKADLLHLHDSAAIALGVPAAALLGKLPTVVHRRISSPMRRNPWSKAVYRARCIDAYLAVSEAARRSLLEIAVPEERTLVVPSGVDIRRLTPVVDRRQQRLELGLRADAQWIGIVGALEVKKDVETFIRAAAIAGLANPERQFLVVGDGPERARLELLAGQLGMAGRIHFAGCATEATRFTAALDVFAFTSLREGSPGVVKEAMALGVPVVAAASPGTDEIVTADTGLLVAPGQPAAFAAAMSSLLTDRQLAVGMVQRARLHVEQCFPIEQTVERTVCCYRRIVGPVAMPVYQPRDRAAATRSA